ncbi:hypothetical protein GCM10009613_36320 [Pseudonocardia kongjuensis]|uniref:Uncharacterized protein n=1 Tax=Pseudonocardia kongjuensis TaxID=102227 RepID=A0ABN1XX96_9PSEU
MSGTPDEHPGTAPRPAGSVDEALDVHTEVVHERGRWIVEIVVVFADGVVRRRISSHPTEARARISARLIRRAAERDTRDLR